MAENTGITSMPVPAAEPRYPVLLLVIVASAGLGALLVGVAVGALLSFLPSAVGFALGLVLFGLALPLFLALRAAAALKRRKRGPLVRLLVVLFLLAATQLSVFGAVLQYSSRTTGHLAMTAYEVLELVGHVPLISDLLFAHAERNDVKPRAPRATPAPDAGPRDGGAGPAHAGSAHAGSAHAGPADAGPHDVAAHGGVPAAPASPPTSSAPTAKDARLPAPPAPKPDVGLSPRTAGKAARTVALGVRTGTGDTVVHVLTVGAGGQATGRTVSLGVHEKLGELTGVEVAEDGHLALVAGGAHLLWARPGRGAVEPVKGLAPGQRIGNLEVQGVRDAVVGPGGHMLAVVDLLAPALKNAASEVLQALVSVPNGPRGQSAPQILRKTGDAVPDAATDSSVARSFMLKKSSGAGSVLVVESYADGGADLVPRLSGEVWSVNPQRLLAVKLDAPKALVELVRTGTEPAGISDVELQLFGDAWLNADGSALVDANFLERSAEGWLFVVKQGSGVRALAADRRDTDSAPWPRTGTRTRGLEATSDGTFVFRREDGAAVLGHIERPTEATAALLGADALTGDGKAVGQIVGVDVPVLVRGGEWIVASVRIGRNGATHDAVVLASRTDVGNGKAEVLVEVGRPLPASKAGAPAVAAIFFEEGREELLWQR